MAIFLVVLPRHMIAAPPCARPSASHSTSSKHMVRDDDAPRPPTRKNDIVALPLFCSGDPDLDIHPEQPEIGEAKCNDDAFNKLAVHRAHHSPSCWSRNPVFTIGHTLWTGSQTWYHHRPPCGRTAKDFCHHFPDLPLHEKANPNKAQMTVMPPRETMMPLPSAA
jgi:hypothetical protein